MTEVTSMFCPDCGKECKDKRGLSVHLKRCNQIQSTVCSHCNHDFKTTSNLDRHLGICVNLKLNTLKKEYEAQLKSQKETYDTEISKYKQQLAKETEFHQNQLKGYHEESHCLNKQVQELTSSLKNKIEEHTTDILEFKKKETYYNRRIEEYMTTISSLAIDKISSQQACHNNSTTINNFNTNTFQIYTFDPNKFRGKIPSNRLITSEDQLVNHLIENGIKNYYRVTDKSRGTIVWVNQKGQEIRDSGGVTLTTQLYETLHEDFLAQKEYSSSQLDKDNLTDDQYSKFRNSVNVSNKVLQRNSESIKEVGKKLGKKGIDKASNIIPNNPPSSTELNHFYQLICGRLCENVISWLWLEYDEFAIFFYDLMQDKIIQRTHTHLHRPYFTVRSDLREEIQLYWDDFPVILQTSLKEQFFGPSQEVIRQLINQHKPSPILCWLDDPTEEVSKEIMTSFLKA